MRDARSSAARMRIPLVSPRATHLMRVTLSVSLGVAAVLGAAACTRPPAAPPTSTTTTTGADFRDPWLVDGGSAIPSFEPPEYRPGRSPGIAPGGDGRGLRGGPLGEPAPWDERGPSERPR
jgi:hypothetical protein